MPRKKQCIAMLLAGGQGSRLGILTKDTAKPAVPFGGKYRLIDFPLSNCTNSGLDVVGVLTQYQPLELNSYLGNGQPWDLDRTHGGVYVLPPYVKGKAGQWYRGTANAIYQNIGFIDQYDPEYVMVLGGDHIYTMDYEKMLAYHRKQKAEATIAVREVPWDEAPRFGIMNTDENDQVYEFEEKPKKPKSNKASMGVYIFTWQTLRRYLIQDEADKSSSNDFGSNIIPKMLADGCILMAYEFDGYWKDVGTIESLWEANMELLEDPPVFDLYNKNRRVYSRNAIMPPHYIAPGAEVTDSIVTEGCQVRGRVHNSVLFSGVTVEEDAIVEDSVVMPGCIIGKGAQVRRAILAENAILSPKCSVGGRGDIAVIGKGIVLPEGMSIESGVQVDKNELAQRMA